MIELEVRHIKRFDYDFYAVFTKDGFQLTKEFHMLADAEKFLKSNLNKLTYEFIEKVLLQ